MANTLLFVPNAEAFTMPAGAAVEAVATPVDLTGILSGAAPLSKAISYPGGASGRLRIVVGAGAGSFSLTLQATDVPSPKLRTVTVPIAGPGTYPWPNNRVSLAYGIKSVSSAMAPGGSVQIFLDRYDGKLGTDGSSSALGINRDSTPPGKQLTIISSGPAAPACSGGWSTGDDLCAGPSGTLREIGPGETGIDRVATAGADQADGDVACPVDVGIQAL